MAATLLAPAARAYDYRSYNQTLDQTQAIPNTDFNQPRWQQPLFHPGTLPFVQGDGQQITLWTGPVNYSRQVKFKKPFLQQNMKLGVRFNYTFNFNLRSRDARAHAQQIPDGWYQLDMAVVLPENTTEYFIAAAGKRTQLTAYQRLVTSQSMFVEVTGGTVTRDITFDFNNLSSTTVMNNLFIEFTPLQEKCPATEDQGKPAAKTKSKVAAPDCIKRTADGKPNPQGSIIKPRAGYKPFLVSMPFVPYVSGGHGEGNPDDAPKSPNPDLSQSLSEYIALAKAAQAQNAIPAGGPSPAQFAARNGLTLLNLDNPSDNAQIAHIGDPLTQGGRAESLLRQLLAMDGMGTLALTENYRRLMPVLCSLLAAHNEEVQGRRRPDGRNAAPLLNMILNRCTYKPEDVLRLSRVTHVAAFDNDNTQNVIKDFERLTIQTNFMISRSYSEDILLNVSPTAILFRILDAFGIPLSGVSYSAQVGHGRGKSESSSGSLSKNMDFNFIGMKIPVLKSQRCLEVRALPDVGSPFYDGRPEATKNGLYICLAPNSTPYSTSEMYAHFFVHSGETSIIDDYDPEAQSINLALQGDRDISSFMYLARKSMTADHNSRITPFLMLENADRIFRATPATENNMIINPLEFPGEETPSIWMRAFHSGPTERFIDDN